MLEYSERKLNFGDIWGNRYWKSLDIVRESEILVFEVRVQKVTVEEFKLSLLYMSRQTTHS